MLRIFILNFYKVSFCKAFDGFDSNFVSMILDTGPEFYGVPSSSQYVT